MGTRSSIGVMQQDGSVKSIYCHWDGYYSHVGKMLYKHYNTEEKANAVVALGGLSSLYENLTPLPEAKPNYTPRGEQPRTILAKDHSFDTPQENVTVAYHRDRGEKLSINKFSDLKSYNRSGDFQGYDYLYKDGAWHTLRGKKWILLTEEMISEE